MLDISKLWGMTQNGAERGKPTRVRPCGKMEFRCPACALEGHDKGYDHLVVFKDNTNFGCSKFTKDSGPEFEKHRNEIWKRVGIGTKATHRPEPFISPRKITKSGTLIAKHDADLAEERRKTLELRAKAKLNQPTQHIVYNANKMSNGTFGTPFSVSHQSPSPLYNNIPNGNTDKTIPPHVPPTLKKSSQMSHFVLLPGGRWLPGCTSDTESYFHPTKGIMATRSISKATAVVL